jgi:hypothetical protein
MRREDSNSSGRSAKDKMHEEISVSSSSARAMRYQSRAAKDNTPMHGSSDSDDFELDAEAAMSDEESLKGKKKAPKYNKYAKKGNKEVAKGKESVGKGLSQTS